MERDFRGWTALDRAAHEGSLAKIRSLLLAGANPNDGDLGGYTPLYRAIKAGHEAAALLLLEAVDRAPATRQQNPLSNAVSQLLPENPVAPDQLLRLAAEKGLNGFVDTLLKLQRTTPRAQEIALQVAAHHGHLQMVMRLLQQPGVSDLDPALDVSIDEGHLLVAELLLEKGASPSDRSLEHSVYHKSELLEKLRQRFPSRLGLAEARVHCKHENMKTWEYGHYCEFCGGRWP